LPAKFRSKVLAIGANLYKRYKLDIEGVMRNTAQKSGEIRLIFSNIWLILLLLQRPGRGPDLFYQQGKQDLHDADEKAERSPDDLYKTKFFGDDIV
jgi:hypothetical protein